jgi:hypothetical protein
LQIEFIRKLKAFRKEARVKEILAEKGKRGEKGPGPNAANLSEGSATTN